MGSLILGIPSSVVNLVQTGLLERAFHDALLPNFMFRAEAAKEEWEANSGTELFMTRAGLLAPVTKPMVAGQDPIPQTLSYEQWVARLERYSGTIDTHMPTSAVAHANQLLRNINTLGIQAAQSLNRIARNAMYKTYLGGHTVLIAATASGDTGIRVAALNGFTEVVSKGITVRPSQVSSNTPLSITIMNGATAITRNVTGFAPDNPDDPDGPGTLLLSAAVGAIVPVRSAVLSSARPKVFRCGGGNSVDAVSLSDGFMVQDAVKAVNWLRKQNVPPHEDGLYHAHVSTDGNTQVFTDPLLQRLNQGRGVAGTPWENSWMGDFGGVRFFSNNEVPDNTNSGALTATGSVAQYSEDIGAETINENGVSIGRILVTGRGVMYEKYLDESAYVTDAGITGKEGNFQIVNAGMEVSTENIRLILRAPLNRTQDQVAATWSITTSFALPSDVSSGGPERYKRGVVIEHALEV